MRDADSSVARLGAITRRVLRGLALFSAVSALAHGVSFVSTIVVARLLVPADFGLMTMALQIFLLTSIFTESALPQALVQSRQDAQRTANTAFLLVPAVALLLHGSVIISSPLVAAFFGAPEATPVIAALGVSYIVLALGRASSAMMDRDLSYGRRAIQDVVAPLVQAVTNVALAVSAGAALGVWVLVGGHVAAAIVSTVAGVTLAGWRPSWQFDKQIARSLLGFMRDVAGVGVLVLIIRRVDNVAIGKFLGAEQLGLYAMAFNVSQLPNIVLSRSLARVLFPAYSRMQNDLASLRHFHRLSTKLIAMLVLPLTGLIVVIAPDFIPSAYGPRWEGAVVTLQILALAGLISALQVLNGTLLTATGHRNRAYPAALVILALTLLFIVPALQLGIAGVALLTTFAAGSGLFAGDVLAARAIGNRFREHLSPLARPAVAAAGASFGVSWTFHSLFGRLDLWLQGLMGLALAGVYLLLLVLIDRPSVVAFLSLAGRGPGGHLGGPTAGPWVEPSDQASPPKR